MTDLKELLDGAADDRGRAFSTDLDDLLRRARGARRRHRLRTTGTAVVAAALVAAVPLTGTHFGGSADSPAPANRVPSSPRPTPSTSDTPSASPSTVPEPLTADVIAQRCLPQVSRTSPGVPQVEWVLVHPDRTYAVGDVVGLVDAHPPTYDLGNGQVADLGAPPTLCVIPEAGDEAKPVPARAFQPRPAQHELITQLCSQVAPQGPGPTVPDLRGAELVAVAADGERVAAVARQSGKTYTCTLDGLTDRRVLGNVYPAADVPLKEILVAVQSTSEGVKSQAATPTAFYWGAGLLPKGISAIVFDFRNRPDERIPVTDRAYAFVVTQSPAYGVGAFRTKLLNASGAVVCTSGWSDAGGAGYACPGAR